MSEKIAKSSGNGINLMMPPMKVAVIGAGLVRIQGLNKIELTLKDIKPI